MFQKQKEVILALLKSAEADRNYTNNYWFSYTDFLDPEDAFTSFSCDDLDGKKGYISLIENVLKADESAKVFVEVYGFEEDIFPSDIGELTDFSSRTFVIDDNGDLVPAVDFCDDGYSVYFCWWD